MRCVSGQILSPEPFVVDQNCAVVHSPSTGLSWQRTVEASAVSWQKALEFCELSKHAGFDDWRLPNAKEYATIHHDQDANPAIDEAVFGPTPAAGFWTSTPDAKDTSQARFWDLLFTWSGVDGMDKLKRVRCVRSL